MKRSIVANDERPFEEGSPLPGGCTGQGTIFEDAMADVAIGIAHAWCEIRRAKSEKWLNGLLSDSSLRERRLPSTRPRLRQGSSAGKDGNFMGISSPGMEALSERLTEGVVEHDSESVDGGEQESVDIMTRHQGLNTARLSSNPLERRFAEEWQGENERSRGPIGGPDTLDYILHQGDQRWPMPCSVRDREVANSVIQWLGSPVGESFVRRVLTKRSGADSIWDER